MNARGWLGLLCLVSLACGATAWAMGPDGPAQQRPPRRTLKPRSTKPPNGAVGRTRPPTPQRPRTQPAIPPPPPSPARQMEHPLVELEITGHGETWGRIVLELHPERTPLAVRNFLQYVDDGFYDGTIFHRVLPGYIIQGGGYASLTEEKTAGLRPPIRNESRRGAPKNERGTLAMARKHDPHTAASQFYINLTENEHLDYPKAGAYGYCVFGEVIAGMDVVDRIAKVPAHVSAAAQRRFERYQEEGRPAQEVEKSEPLDPPMIKRARQITWEEYAPRSPATPPVTQPVVEPAGEEEPPPEDEAEPLPDDDDLDQPEDLPEDEPGDEPGDEEDEPA